MKLAPGIYEQLVTREMDPHLQDPARVSDTDPLHTDAAPDLLAHHLYDAARRALSALTGYAQVALTNRLIALLATEYRDYVDDGDTVTPHVLLSLLEKEKVALGKPRLERLGIPLRHSELIVNGPRDLRVGLEIARELPSADRVDLLMSFVKWSGYVELKDALSQFRPRPLRLLTTTYMGATEIEALEAFRELGAEIRVSYDERRTRLHAKAWLFQRDSGFGTAIIGLSNLAHAALRDGCEWNVRLSQRDNPGLLTKFRTTFDQSCDASTNEALLSHLTHVSSSARPRPRSAPTGSRSSTGRRPRQRRAPGCGTRTPERRFRHARYRLPRPTRWSYVVGTVPPDSQSQLLPRHATR